MLMRLGRWLRLLGQDVANPDDVDDRQLMEKAKAENRTLLTRDRRLAEACSKAGISCILIHSAHLEDQLKEIASRDISLDLKPLRCTICNCPLRRIEAGEMEDSEIGAIESGAGKMVSSEIGAGERESSEKEIWQCEGCKKLYWEGSHWRNIEKALDKVRSQKK
jgi:uncharacterized protein with PIN domain